MTVRRKLHIDAFEGTKRSTEDTVLIEIGRIDNEGGHLAATLPGEVPVGKFGDGAVAKDDQGAGLTHAGKAPLGGSDVLSDHKCKVIESIIVKQADLVGIAALAVIE